MAPPRDFSLTLGYWIVSHKQTLRTWWAIVLMSTIALTLLWSLWFFSVFFSQELGATTQLLEEANGVASFRAASLQPTNLTVTQPSYITRDDKHIDVVAIVNNSNAQWGASSVSGHFVVNGTSLGLIHFFLNPGATRPVMTMNELFSSTVPPTVEFVIDETIWARASESSFPEPKFTVSGALADPSTVVIDGQSRSSVTLHADVTNTSVYNFYHVDVVFVAYDGQRVVGVSSLGVDRWSTLTTKTVSATLTNPIASVTKIDVLPQVSRFEVGNIYR